MRIDQASEKTDDDYQIQIYLDPKYGSIREDFNFRRLLVAAAD
jgi:hypothetical protein